MLENAVRICDAKFGIMNFPEPSGFRPAAMHNVPEAFADFVRRDPVIHFGPKHPLARAAATKQVVHIPDLELYADEDAVIAKFRELTGARTILHVPMLKGEQLVGIVSIYRQQVRPFADKQIDLVKNFAAQAVIAIENARLLNELRQSLEQQTATADVLKVISSSPGALGPVFKALLENATQLCSASYGNLWLCEGDAFRSVALHGELPENFIERWGVGALFKPEPDVPFAMTRAAKTKRPCQIADTRASEPYLNGNPLALSAVEAGILAVLAVPMLMEGELVGAILIYSREARPFTEKQIELLENFAAQAVIAIENARLLNELRQSLEQQTATAEVLQVVSSSLGDLEPVFTTMLEKAVRICAATFGNIYRWDGEFLSLAATHKTPPLFAAEVRRRSQHPRDPKTVSGRMLETKAVVHIADLAAERVYLERHPAFVAGVELGGVRTILAVPMWKEDELIGSFTVYRQEVRPFTEKQIGLVQNFAAQAVIAIENTRLLKELRERTQQVEAQAKELSKLNQKLEQRVADQVGEIERMSRLRRFLPRQVADLIVASGSEKQLESHRREITALFCDLRGFTGFTESADAEDVMALLREYHAAIGEKIVKYSGTLERYAGDGVMVVFNDPVPVENPALQAVLMALEMREAIGALTETWRRWGHEIGFGIGIAHGFATLGTIGFEGRFDYAAIGTVSNVASRLCDEAKPGQILISPRVLTKVENAVEVEPVGEFELKGIRRPLAAYNVIGTAAKG
jgi:class 3 adenylate cyclase/putative methionine-R-sulfoxide reductase with GAF domain